MNKPDFGIGPGGLHVIQWTDERRSYVEWLAGQGKSARDIALDIGLKASQAPRISAACLRFGIELKGQSGRKPRSQNVFRSIEVSAEHRVRIVALAKARGVDEDVMLARIVAANFDQGDTFVANLLDEE